MNPAPSIVITKEMTPEQVYDAAVKLAETGCKMKASNMIVSAHETQGYHIGKISAIFSLAGFKFKIKQNPLAKEWWTMTYYIDEKELSK